MREQQPNPVTALCRIAAPIEPQINGPATERRITALCDNQATAPFAAPAVPIRRGGLISDFPK
jgi:hypothetical protein